MKNEKPERNQVFKVMNALQQLVAKKELQIEDYSIIQDLVEFVY